MTVNMDGKVDSSKHTLTVLSGPEGAPDYKAQYQDTSLFSCTVLAVSNCVEHDSTYYAALEHEEVQF